MEVIKKLIGVFILLCLFTIVGCSANGFNQIKADTFDIGLAQSLYSGNGKVDKETVSSLVEAYNQIEPIGKTDQPINYEKAITITFIHRDQISGSIVIDDKGVFHIDDNKGNYLIEPESELYNQAIELYNNIKMVK